MFHNLMVVGTLVLYYETTTTITTINSITSITSIVESNLGMVESRRTIPSHELSLEPSQVVVIVVE
jgi:hypothetical protein